MPLLHKGDPEPVGRGYRPVDSASELEEFLVKKADDDPKTSTDTNEVAKPMGMANVYEPPTDRETKTNDAPWGEPGLTENGRQQPFHQSTAAWEGSVDTRQGVAKRLLDSKPSSDKVEKALLAQNFKHLAEGDYESHSLALQKQGVAKHVIDEPTLGMRVKELLGRS